MKITASGVLNASAPGTLRAFSTFPSAVVLPDGRMLATYRTGSSKDCDDEAIELRESRDLGLTWSEPRRVFPAYTDEGRIFTLKLVYLTWLPGRLLAAAMAVDRSTFPGRNLFNNETQGCLPMRILLAESDLTGAVWSPWRAVPTPEDIGPPSLTSPLLRLPGGRLALSLESNKTFLDSSPWLQKVVYLFSGDGGLTWGDPAIAARDPSGRVFNWDQRAGVTPDGAIVTFTWVFDSAGGVYRNIWRRHSLDGGASWSDPEDLGFADQASCPAILPDGRVVLAWVDRFGMQAIRARMAADFRATFEADTEVVLYRSPLALEGASGLGETLDEMSRWAYGLPYAIALPDGDVFVVYYAGSPAGTSVYWVRLSL